MIISKKLRKWRLIGKGKDKIKLYEIISLIKKRREKWWSEGYEEIENVLTTSQLN